MSHDSTSTEAVVEQAAAGILGVGWPRVVSDPGLPQIRTCASGASGPSAQGFAARLLSGEVAWRCGLGLAALILGCARHHTTLPDGTRIGVVPFRFAPGAAVTRYEGADADYARVASSLTASVVAGIRRHNLTASVVDDPARRDFDLLVSGQITQLDGGNRALRALVGMAGGATCAVSGTTERANGERVGSFGIEMTKHSAGWFWTQFGESDERQLDAIVEHIGKWIGDVVFEGKYQGGIPPGAVVSPLVPATPEKDRRPSATGRPVADRLRELDSLHSQGLLTDAEYKARRQAILNDL